MYKKPVFSVQAAWFLGTNCHDVLNRMMLTCEQKTNGMNKDELLIVYCVLSFKINRHLQFKMCISIAFILEWKKHKSTGN